MNCRRTVVCAALLVISSCVIGCATSFQRGDARITDVRKDIGRLFFPSDGHVYYSASFPQFRVDQRHTATIRVRGLPADAFFHYSLSSGEPVAGDVYIDRRRLPWLKVVLSFAVRDVQGRTFYSERLTTGDLNWGFYHSPASPQLAGSATIKGLSDALRRRADFDLLVTVERASTRQGDFIELRARGEALR